MLDLIDTHCHLDIPEFDAIRAALLDQCAKAGMRAIVVPAVLRSTWDNLQAVCKAAPQLWPAFGLHPCYMPEHVPADIEALDGYLAPDVVAVGEIGLDAFHGDSDLALQQTYFAAQVAIAKNHRLPIVVHARKTHDLVLKELRKQRFGQGGVVHAFSGSLQQAECFIELGFAIGFGGGATYDRAQKLRAILKTVSRDNIVLETDSPDIPPSFARHQANTPFNLFRITEILADVLQIPATELAQQTTRNALRIFRSGTEFV